MTFALPSAWLLSAIALPIVILYILKVRMRRVPVATNMFWQQIYDEKPPRSIWQYLRHLFSLLMQLLLLCLLVLAVADPYFSWQMLQAKRVVLVIDNSASMQAPGNDGLSRFEDAIQSAKSWADGLRFRDEAAIVLAGPSPEVVLGMSNHVPTLKRSLDGLQVSDNPTQLENAVALGQRLVEDHPRGEIVIFTDGCAAPLSERWFASKDGESPNSSDPTAVPQADSEASPTVQVKIRRFGDAESDNVGLTQFQVRRSLVDPLGYEVLASVFNASKKPVKCRLTISLDDRVADVLPLKLAPGERWSKALEKTSLEGGVLVGKLTEFEANTDDVSEVENDGGADDAAAVFVDGLSTDNTAWAILPARKILSVTLVTSGNLFLQKVLEANPLVRVNVVEEIPAAWSAEDGILLLHREVPQEIPAGRTIVIDPVGACDLWALGEPLDNPIITQQDQNSPLMAHVRLDNVVMPKARELDFTGAPRALASAIEGQPVYAELKEAGRHCLVLTVDLDSSDLAFRTAFPILMSNALSHLGGDSGEIQQALPTGSVHRMPANFDGPREVVPPSGAASAIAMHKPVGATAGGGNPRESFSVTIGPLSEVGLWKVRAAKQELSSGGVEPAPTDDATEDAKVDALIAVNLANERESDLNAEQFFLDHADVVPQVSQWLTRPVWFYVVALACGLFAIEWFLYQRRVIS